MPADIAGVLHRKQRGAVYPPKTLENNFMFLAWETYFHVLFIFVRVTGVPTGQFWPVDDQLTAAGIDCF